MKIALLGHNGDALLDAHRGRNHVDTHNVRGATCGNNTGGQYANRRRLTRPIRSEQTEDLAAPYRKRNAIYSIDACLGIAFHQVFNFNRNYLFWVFRHKNLSPSTE